MHKSIIQRSEKNPSLMVFWKKEQVAEASTSKESGKLSILVMSSSGEQKSSLLTKFPLTKEHHRVEIIWAYFVRSSNPY